MCKHTISSVTIVLQHYRSFYNYSLANQIAVERKKSYLKEKIPALQKQRMIELAKPFFAAADQHVRLVH